jgi:hypothetical protein
MKNGMHSIAVKLQPDPSTIMYLGECLPVTFEYSIWAVFERAGYRSIFSMLQIPVSAQLHHKFRAASSSCCSDSKIAS